VISDLAKVNNMYQFSLGAFLRTFQRSLELPDVSISKDKQVIFTQRCMQSQLSKRVVNLPFLVRITVLNAVLDNINSRKYKGRSFILFKLG
jgi:aminopeptidase N